MSSSVPDKLTDLRNPVKVVAMKTQAQSIQQEPQKSCPNCSMDYPATADYFSPHAKTADGLMKICKKCQASKISEGYKKPKTERPSKLKKARFPRLPIGEPKEKPRTTITIDFSHHHDIYEQLIQIAAKELRTPEMQALYCIQKAAQL
jgi:hypothetical protein